MKDSIIKIEPKSYQANTNLVRQEQPFRPMKELLKLPPICYICKREVDLFYVHADGDSDTYNCIAKCHGKVERTKISVPDLLQNIERMYRGVAFKTNLLEGKRNDKLGTETSSNIYITNGE